MHSRFENVGEDMLESFCIVSPPFVIQSDLLTPKFLHFTNLTRFVSRKRNAKTSHNA